VPERFGGPEVSPGQTRCDARARPKVRIDNRAGGVDLSGIPSTPARLSANPGSNTMIDVRTHEHTMTRIDVATGLDYDAFVAAFERAAPEFDSAPIQSIAASGGSWEEIRAAIARNAPNDLMFYAKIDATPLFSVAGHRVKAIEYLLGNHVIAEMMFRHDPKALLYAPLRVLEHGDADGNAVFSIDRPSTAFASLGIADVTSVGESLDGKVAALLREVGVEATSAFQQAVGAKLHD
jgi:hypothetical protein